MIPGEPLATNDGDLPHDFLNQVSAACRDVDSLGQAYVGWLRPYPDGQSHVEPAARLTIVLHYGIGEPTVEHFRQPRFTGDLVFVDGSEVRVLPDHIVIHTHGPAVEPGVERRWVRVH